MNARAAFVGRHRRLLLQLTAAWTAIGVLLFVLAPLSTPALLLLSAVAPTAWCLASKGLSLARPSAMTLVLTLAAGYLIANASWSLRPSEAHAALYMLLVSVVALHFMLGGLPDCDADTLCAMAVGLYVGMAIGGAVICFETFSLQWFHRLLMSAVPAL